MPATFYSITLSALRAFRSHWKEFVVLIVTTAVLTAGLHVIAAWQAERSYERLIDERSVSDDMEILEALRSEQETGNRDPAIEKEIQQVRARVSSRMQALAGYATGHTPVGLLFFSLDALLSLLVMLSTFTWILWRTADTESDAATIGRRMLLHLPQAAGLIASMFLVSLLWIPGLAIVMIKFHGEPFAWPLAGLQTTLIFIGYLVAVLLLPRLALAPVLMTREPIGSFSALLASYERTRGYWAKIIGTLLGAIALLLLLCAMLSSLGGHMELLLILWKALLLQSAIALFALFLVELSESIIAFSQKK